MPLLLPHLSTERRHPNADTLLEGVDLSFQPSPFETDSNKVTYCDGLRALADKTQVHDRIHAQGLHRNRLTHSLEVSCVGRSLGNAIGHVLSTSRKVMQDINTQDLPNRLLLKGDTLSQVVAAACLAHDIGNPPFGHDGEDTISRFFTSNDIGQTLSTMVSDTKRAELQQHEGNAQGFRMITESMGWRDNAGLNLTASSLAAFCKYPHTLRAGVKKYGVHHQQLDTLHWVAEQSNMISDGHGGYAKHLGAWLMEAADDICYLVVDFEDAALLGLVSFEDVLTMFGKVLPAQIIKEARANPEPGKAILHLRSHMIKTLIHACTNACLNHLESILKGKAPKRHGGGLIGLSIHGEAMLEIRTFSQKNIYRSHEVQSQRGVFQKAMTLALSRLGEDLLDRLNNRRLGLHRNDNTPLARLPGAQIGTHIPQDPDKALSWFLDQITLTSDGLMLDMGTP